MLDWLRNRGHRRYRALLSGRLDGRLDEREQAALQAHLSGCAECRQELAELEATVGLLRRQPQIEPPRSFALAYAPLREAAIPRLLRTVRTLQVATGAAALVLVALVTADLTGVTGESATQQPAALAVAEAEAGDTSATAGASIPDAQDDAAGIETFRAAPPQDEITFEVATPIPAAGGEPDTALPADDDGRSAWGWLFIAVGLAAAALALGAVGMTWRAGRSPPA